MLLAKDLRIVGEMAEPHLLFTPGVKTPSFTTGELSVNHAFARRFLSADADERDAQMCGFADVAAITLILALATTNVRKKTVGNKRARLGIGKAEHKQYSQITYLSLPEAATGAKHRSGDERAAVRMHLRRGHPRHQHFGKGNAQVKRIWIAP